MERFRHYGQQLLWHLRGGVRRSLGKAGLYRRRDGNRNDPFLGNSLSATSCVMRRRILQEVAAQRMASLQGSLSCVSRVHPALRFGPNRPTTGITISVGTAEPVELPGFQKLYLRAFQGIQIDLERSTLLPPTWIGYVEEYAYRIGTSEL